MRSLAGNGFAAPGFAADHGGTGDVGAAVTGIETLGYADLSLMVKSGVQWGFSVVPSKIWAPQGITRSMCPASSISTFSAVSR